MRTELWTDGSGTVRGEAGGWAYVLRALADDGEVLKEVEASGGDPDTTNNRMEMTALLEGLRALKRPTTVTVVADSEYVLNAFAQGWLARWKANGWSKTPGGRKPPANVDLWQAIDAAAAPHVLTTRWVRGHTGIELNERCDELAGLARLAAEPLPVAVVEATGALDDAFDRVLALDV